MGMLTLVVADRDLEDEEPVPRRVRGLELTEDALILFQTGGNETWRVLWKDISLLITGRLFTREIEVEERKGRGTENEIVDAREMSSDESVLDIYAARDKTGWRITAGNFDFSCLGPQKKLVAAQNFSTLVELFRARATEALSDDSYHRLRTLFAHAWPLEQETESRGWRRKGPGRVSTEAVTRSDNEIQFTRYSRLRRYLQLHQPGQNA
jgi:hypothetical protein